MSCREKLIIPSHKPYISFVGNESQMSNTIISWNDKASDRDSNGGSLGTYKSASVTIESDYFCATEITFEVIITLLFDSPKLVKKLVSAFLNYDN